MKKKTYIKLMVATVLASTLLLGACGNKKETTQASSTAKTSQSSSSKATAFDVFYLNTIFLIVYVALLFLHENYLKYRYKNFFTHMLSNSKKDGHP